MCVENGCVLELHSNPLFTPVPLMNGRFPLTGCVLSVSQFTGAEKKSVEELTQFLGAVYVKISVSSSCFCMKGQIINLLLFLRLASKITLCAQPTKKKACCPTLTWCCRALRAQSIRLLRNGDSLLSPWAGFWNVLGLARRLMRSGFSSTCHLHQVESSIYFLVNFLFHICQISVFLIPDTKLTSVNKAVFESDFTSCVHNISILYSIHSLSAEKDESFVGDSQKSSMPPPVRLSTDTPLLGFQSGKAVTPLNFERFQSKAFRSVLNDMHPKEPVSTPKQNQEGSKRNQLQKEPSLQLDTPSRFLSRDQLFQPCFHVKVVTH